MIEVTDGMLALLREYQMGAYGELDDDCDKRMIVALIELHEQSKPKPKPVGYGLVIKGVLHATKDEAGSVGFVPLYTNPPTREPLSEDFLMNLAEECTAQFFNGVHQNATIHFARAVEQAHGIGVK